MYLVDDVFVVSNVVLKGNDRLPGVPLSKHAATGGLVVFMESHSQWITAEKKQDFLQQNRTNTLIHAELSEITITNVTV